MEDNNIQSQIDALDKKLDLILGYVQQQRLQSTVVEDLVSDLTIIGKDVYDSTVEELDKRQIELQPSELTDLAVSLLRNIGNFRQLMDLLEMMMDLAKEVGPIANEVIIDFTKQLHDFEQKGYFNLVKEIMPFMDKVVMTLNKIDSEEIPSYSIWKIMREMNSPEMKKTMGFAFTFMKEISK